MLNKFCILFSFVLFASFNGYGEGKSTMNDFEIQYKVISGRELTDIFNFESKSASDHYYVVGSIFSRKKNNSLVEISFRHKKDKTFNTAGFRNVGWVDGNNSAVKFFLIPIGLRDVPLPENPNDLQCEVRETFSK